MFDIGFWELAIIGLIALLVLGPERLPGFARSVGRWVGKAQRMTREFKRDLEREVDLSEVRKLKQDLKSAEFDAFARDINREIHSVSQDLNRQIDLDAETKPPVTKPTGGTTDPQ